MKLKIFLILCLLFTWTNFVLASEKININTATSEDLKKIIHIGEKRALEIIALRPFQSLDDLIKVKGIGPKTLADIKQQGLASIGINEVSGDLPLEVNTTTNVSNLSTKEKRGVVYASEVVINEILPWPEGPDAQEEWIELLNQNSFDVDLSSWAIQDTDGKTKTYTFPLGTIIKASEFLVLRRPNTKIVLNNEGDGLELLHPNGNTINAVRYPKAPKEQSYNRSLKDFSEDEIWFWNNKFTPGSENDISILISQEEKERLKENILAQVSRPTEPIVSTGKKFVFILAGIVALFSALAVALLKMAR